MLSVSEVNFHRSPRNTNRVKDSVVTVVFRVGVDRRSRTYTRTYTNRLCHGKTLQDFYPKQNRRFLQRPVLLKDNKKVLVRTSHRSKKSLIIMVGFKDS